MSHNYKRSGNCEDGETLLRNFLYCPYSKIEMSLQDDQVTGYIMCVVFTTNCPFEKRNIPWNSVGTCDEIKDEKVCKTITLTFGEKPFFIKIHPAMAVPEDEYLRGLLQNEIVKLSATDARTEKLQNFHAVYYHVREDEIEKMEAFEATVDEWFKNKDAAFTTLDYLPDRDNCPWFDLIRHPNYVCIEDMPRYEGFWTYLADCLE